jgi:hypothetical protein
MLRLVCTLLFVRCVVLDSFGGSVAFLCEDLEGCGPFCATLWALVRFCWFERFWVCKATYLRAKLSCHTYGRVRGRVACFQNIRKERKKGNVGYPGTAGQPSKETARIHLVSKPAARKERARKKQTKYNRNPETPIP